MLAMHKLTRRDFLGLMGYGAAFAALQTGCGKSAFPDEKPNVLWVLWDTARADHMSLYGYNKPTTPFLENWTSNARVFDNCISTANSTLPAHASMFTALMPSEHGRNNADSFLTDSFTTIAELLQQSGYRTYMYSANPAISRGRNFSQGFDLAEHPWDEKYQNDAIRILAHENLQPGEGDEQVRPGRFNRWQTKERGAIAQRAVKSWLRNRPSDKPFFVFLNYMEAHRPYVPHRPYRQRLMNLQQLTESYQVKPTWTRVWSYTFGQTEYSEEKLALTRLLYDAALAELDDLFKELITSLGTEGHLENTIVILTSDHGELLGEKHMFDHQFSLAEPLVRVPLMIHYPERFSPGRDDRPVVNFDLFPTLLELIGLEMPSGLHTEALSLLHPQADRIRMAQCPVFLKAPLEAVKEVYPDFDPTPWQRSLRALYQGRHKYIWSSDQQDELYDLALDAGELKNLIAIERDRAGKFAQIHDQWQQSFHKAKDFAQPGPALSEEERKRLESLGYIGGKEK